MNLYQKDAFTQYFVQTQEPLSQDLIRNLYQHKDKFQERCSDLITLLELAIQAMKDMESNAGPMLRAYLEKDPKNIQLGKAIKIFFSDPRIKSVNTMLDMYVLVEWLKRLRDVIIQDQNNNELSNLINWYIRHYSLDTTTLNSETRAKAYYKVQAFVSLY